TGELRCRGDDAHGHGTVSFAPDGKKLVYLRRAPRGDETCAAQLLDFPSLLVPQTTPKWRRDAAFNLSSDAALCFAPDSRTVACADLLIELRDTASGELRSTVTIGKLDVPQFLSVGYHPDGAVLIAVVSMIRAQGWDIIRDRSVFAF